MEECSYHVVIFDDKDLSPCSFPCYDLKFFVDIATNDSFNDLINKIIVDLNRWDKNKELDSKQKKCKKYLDRHRKNLTIKVGKTAIKAKDLRWKRLTDSRRYEEASIDDQALIYFDPIPSTPNDKRCIYWIGVDHGNKTKPTKRRKSRSKQQLTLTPTTRSRRKRKRTRTQYDDDDNNDIDIDHDNNDNNNNDDNDNEDDMKSFEMKPPSTKRRKKRNKKQRNKRPVISIETNETEIDEMQSLHSNHECLWILVDGSSAMSGKYNKKISRIDKVTDCIKTIISSNWPCSQSITYQIGLFLFGQRMINLIGNPLKYTTENERLIMDKLERIEISPTNSMTVLEAVEHLTDRILNKKENIECGRHRICLFVGKHGEDSALTPSHSLRIKNLKDTLKKAQIIFDVIQVSNSHRPNGDIIKLTDGNGKLWNPSVNLEEWQSVVICHDFVHPEQRNVGYEEAILID